jgi:phthalate 4,5-dioxygenase
MLSREDNEALTRTGPETPMGRLMRLHWFPFMAAKELAAGGPPKRVSLLNERLVAFRGRDGGVGLLEEFCPHRGVSLYYGRNEEAGLRCAYHGWQFDAAGRCLDMPSEPRASQFKDKVRARAYPCVEHKGLLWTHMGPDARRSDLPHLAWTDFPDDHLWSSRWLQECNYAQAIEGEIDESHVSFLHSRTDALSDNKLALTGAYLQQDTAPAYVVHETDYGLACGSRRQVEDGKHLWRINLFLLPFFSLICPSDDPHLYIARAWIPADDEHTWVICTSWRTDRAASPREIAMWENGEVQHRRLIPGTTTPLERADNEYLIDRDEQMTTSYSGIRGIRAQDAMATESPGPIVDRTKEHLGSSDRAVIAFRRRMLAAARALEAGAVPRTAIDSDVYRVFPCQTLRDDDSDFFAVPEIRATMTVQDSSAPRAGRSVPHRPSPARRRARTGASS